MKTVLASCVILLFASRGSAGDKFTVTPVQAAPPAELAEPVQKLLDPKSAVVKHADSTTLCQLWFRSEIPVKATAEQVKNGLTYREVIETSLIGAVRFAQTFTDYRKQEITAGVYTLRIAFQPDNGDHKDSAPHTEFALLCPADKDTKPEEMEAKALYKLSFASTGGEHPGVMLLFPNAKPAGEPSVVDRGSGVWTVNVKRPVKTDEGKADLGFALTIAGFSKLR